MPRAKTAGFFHSRRTPPASSAPRAATRKRLELEFLEDRVVPSSLQLAVAPHTVVEGTGANSTAVATVTRVNADNSAALTVNLTSSDTT